MRSQVVVIRHGLGTGLRFDAGGANPGYALGTTEPLVQSTLEARLHAGDIFYDIGANVGFFSVLGARLVGPTGTVYAFEPFPANAASLRRNVQLNGFHHVTVIEAALSRTAGEGWLVVGEEPTWGRLASGGASRMPHGWVRVPLMAIDDLVDRGTIAPPALVKIDVEGAELDVVAGMTETIRRHRPVIICEMHGRNKEYGALMRELNYEVRTLGVDLPVEDARWDVHTLATPGAESGVR